MTELEQSSRPILEYMASARGLSHEGAEITCSCCGKKTKHYSKKQHKYGRLTLSIVCTECKSNKSVLVGTMWENTKIPLIKHFCGVYVVKSNPTIGCRELGRTINVNHKSASQMISNIKRMRFDDKDTMLYNAFRNIAEMYVKNDFLKRLE